MAQFKNFTDAAVLGIASMFATGAAGASNSAVVGTGFFVSANGKVITNSHVVRDCRSIAIKGADGRTTDASLAAADNINDLALLTTSTRAPTVMSFQRTVWLGDAAFVYGFPLNGLLSSNGNFTTGTITALAGIGDDSRMLQISAPVQPGNSGGPLLSQTGSVIGVVSSKLDALRLVGVTQDISQNVNFAIKASAALTFLESNGVTPALSPTDAPNLQPPDIAELAASASVRIVCDTGEDQDANRRQASATSEGAVKASSLVELMSQSQWAIRTQENCSVPRQSYNLSVNAGEIAWRSGIGNIDVETMVSSTATSLSTRTVRSVHSNGRGEPPGTSWIYSLVAPDRIRVSPGNRPQFLLVRCQS